MSRGLKIVTIGGGSSYTPELIEGFIKYHNELPVKEIWLVDIEEGKEKLEIVGELARRMVKKAGVSIDIFLTLDRKRLWRERILLQHNYESVSSLQEHLMKKSL